MCILTVFTFASRVVVSYQAACAPVIQFLALQFGYCTDLPLTQLPGLLLRAADASIIIGVRQLFTLAHNSVSYTFLFSRRRGRRQNGARDHLLIRRKASAHEQNRDPHEQAHAYSASTLRQRIIPLVYLGSVSCVYIDSVPVSTSTGRTHKTRTSSYALVPPSIPSSPPSRRAPARHCRDARIYGLTFFFLPCMIVGTSPSPSPSSERCSVSKGACGQWSTNEPAPSPFWPHRNTKTQKKNGSFDAVPSTCKHIKIPALQADLSE